MGPFPFHPLIARWFTTHIGEPSEPQRRGWPEIAAGHDTLVAAPTGSGKTLAAFLDELDGLVRAGLEGTLEDGVQVLYLSPLRALSHDVEKNLDRPLRELEAMAREDGTPLPEIRVDVRTGDTPSSARAHGQAPAARARHHAGVALHPAHE